MAFLELIHLSKNFGSVAAVSDANIQVEEGSFFTFLGPSGCGKTTTLRMIAGFEDPSEGRIVMDGREIGGRPPEQRGIGMMFQNYALFPHMTVFENVAYGLKIKHVKRERLKEQAERYMGMVGLSGYGKRKISQLSGGEQQRVALARSLVTEPKLLLLDEPLSNLDAKMRDEMRFELKRLQRELGITMLYVTHDQSEALIMSNRIAVFNKGKIQQTGAPSEIYNRPANSFVARFVGQSNLVELEKNDGFSVTLPGGAAIRAADAVPGAKYASLRNEYIKLCAKQENVPKEANRVEAQVVSCQFNGMTTYYTILAGGLRLDVTAMNQGFADSFKAGDPVWAWIHPVNVTLLEV